MKKIFIFVSLFFCIFLCLEIKTKAVYVLSPEAMLSQSSEITDEMGGTTEVINTLDTAIDIISDEMDSTNPNVMSMISKAIEIRNTYSNNLPFLSYFDGVQTSIASDMFIASTLSLFWSIDCKLSFELLLQSYITVVDNYTYTNPYYAYVIDDSEIFTSIAHNSITNSSSSFPMSSVDLFLSIHSFNYSKASGSSLTVTITDTYDFETENNFHFTGFSPFDTLLNNIIDTFGYLMEMNVIRPFNLIISRTHTQILTYNNYDLTYHRTSCVCGYSSLQTHNWYSTMLNSYIVVSPNYIPGYKCRKCGATKYSEEL